jgi:hypothetical protein
MSLSVQWRAPVFKTEESCELLITESGRLSPKAVGPATNQSRPKAILAFFFSRLVVAAEKCSGVVDQEWARASRRLTSSSRLVSYGAFLFLRRVVATIISFSLHFLTNAR